MKSREMFVKNCKKINKFRMKAKMYDIIHKERNVFTGIYERKLAGSSQMEVNHESIRKFRTEEGILLF